MFTPAELFAADFRELERLCAEPDAERMLRAAAVLRKLLLDAAPLVHQVNRDVRLKVTFTVSSALDHARHLREVRAIIGDAAQYLSSVDDIDPRWQHQLPTLNLGLDAFLALPISSVGDALLTVRDLIIYAANTAGGVHKGAPTDPRFSDLERVSSQLPADGHLLVGRQSVVMRTILPIARVTVEALRPLYDAVGNQRAAGA